MSRLPQIRPREMIAALQRAGFVVRRIKGSHHFLQHRNDPSRWATVAVHPGDLPVRDVQDILKQARLTRDEFLKLI
jgi:predicted RNA binding protein YcfA (HicA-like mRNA interferase family)